MQGGARFQGVEDDADEQSFEAADRFAAALALEMSLSEGDSRLGKCPAMTPDRREGLRTIKRW